MHARTHIHAHDALVDTRAQGVARVWPHASPPVTLRGAWIMAMTNVKEANARSVGARPTKVGVRHTDGVQDQKPCESSES